MYAGWHDDIDGGWYIQPTGGISAKVMPVSDGFTFSLCGIPMPPDIVYGSVIEAKTAAVYALRAKLERALEKLT